MRVLETACGTGIVTERLAARLAGGGALVATDLNEAMFAHGRARLPHASNIEWRQADATSLPFVDRSFDAVVCQFGLMFYPDKAPFSLHDPEPTLHRLRDAGFADNQWLHVEKVGTSPAADEAAIGLIEGNPIYSTIMERRPEALAQIKAVVAAAIAKELGDNPVRCPERALVFTARRAGS